MNPKLLTTLMFLVGTYIAAEIVSNSVASRLVQFGPFVVPGAIFLYALTFTLRDAIHTIGGLQVAKKLIGVGIVANLVLAVYGLIVTKLPHPAFFDPTAYNTVFGGTLKVVAASILSYWVSNLIDTRIFEKFKDRVGHGVVYSNAASTVLDSALFITLVFAGTGAPLLNLILTQVALKFIISLALIPLVKRLRKNAQQFVG